MRITYQRAILVLTMLIATACGSSGTSYSILASSDTFKQASSSFNNQVDLLWVVDNSSSMDPLQNNMTTNFNSFINQFVTKGYDFQLAVTTTDAYLADAAFNNTPSESKFRDGVNSTHTGVFTIVPSTANLLNVFVTNASQGGNGSGDERAFSSLRSALHNTAQNGSFVRQNSYLGIIILSDEDDFSSASRPEYSWLFSRGVADHSYSYSGLDAVSSYVTDLDTLTASTGASRRYSVNAITVKDTTCLNSHLAQSSSTIIGQRYIQLAGLTNGVVGSICDTSYANTLNAIQQNIVELSTQFFLTKTPDVSTIVVVVNGATIANSVTNGWTYSAGANSITFHGTAVPSEGASIAVNFTPSTLSN